MPPTPDRIARLRGFGLSEYAARAYLALLDLGVTEARDVAALSKVPASKIYHILEQLHEKGLVSILPEFPRKYSPVPFSEHLAKLRATHLQAAEEIDRDRDELESLFAVVGETPGGDRGGVNLMHGRRNLAQRLRELVDATQDEALLALTPGTAGDPRLWLEPVQAALSRGVRVRVLAPRGSAVDVPGLLVAPVEADLGGLVALVDGRLALIGHLLPDDGHPTEGNDTAVAVDQEGILHVLIGLVEARWAASQAGRPVPIESPTAPLSGRTGPTGLMR